MKILYGIQCTGNGHITRSIKIISKLKEMGHQVDIVLSGKNSAKKFPFDVKYTFNGFTFFNTQNGGIDYLKTFMSFHIGNFIKDINLNVNIYDKVITDFEPVTAWACKIQGKKCYGVSNQYSFLSKNTPRDGNSFIGNTILNWMAPVDVAIGLHFKNYDNFIYQPIINDDIIKYKPNDSGHYTTYLPYYGLSKILDELGTFKQTFHIFHGDVNSIYRFKNCLIYPLDKETFFNSFMTSHGVISNAGFQTTSEALYMSKKLMAIPLKGQYEQENNVKALKEIGIFTGDLNKIKDFMETDPIMFDKWDDPTIEIINIILD